MKPISLQPTALLQDHLSTKILKTTLDGLIEPLPDHGRINDPTKLFQKQLTEAMEKALDS